MTIQTLIDCWKIQFWARPPNPPATEVELRAAEAKIGSPIPLPLRQIYQFTNGESFLGGNLRVFPLEPDDFSGLINANEEYNQYGWRVPEEILTFAADGGGGPIGIWLPETGNPIFNHPIIEIGSPPSADQDGSMGVAGTSLVSFLLGYSAYHLMEWEIDLLNAVENGEDKEVPNLLKRLQIALQKQLQVPEELRTDPFYENYEARFGTDYRAGRGAQHFAHIRKWADPLLPDPYGNCYSQEYNVDDLKQLFGEA